MKRVALILGGIVLLLAAVGFMLPPEWSVERSIVIDAPKEVIHAYVGDLAKWPKWTAWTPEREPSLKFSYEGDTSKTGGKALWTSKDGDGVLTVKKTSPRAGMYYEMEMDGGRITANGSILFQKAEGGTGVSWSMLGDVGMFLPARYFMLGADDYLGRDLGEGLKRLKVLAEEDAKKIAVPTSTTSTTAAAGGN